jgi:hypothetical protein
MAHRQMDQTPVAHPTCVQSRHNVQIYRCGQQSIEQRRLCRIEEIRTRVATFIDVAIHLFISLAPCAGETSTSHGTLS